jgi:hypothetical protein
MKMMLYVVTIWGGVLFLFLISCQKLDRPPAPATPLPSNMAPSVNVGNWWIFLPANSVKLEGNATDLDGRIVFYRWTKVSGPPQYTLQDSLSAIALAKNLAEGVYAFEFKVIDDGGLSALDTALVTVLTTCPCSPCDSVANPCDPWDY